MSLVRLAARIAAVNALRGRLFEGVEVLDSQIGAIDVRSDGSLEIGQEKRFVAVYTQGGVASLSGFGVRELHNGGSCEFIFEAGITATMAVRDEETKERAVLEGIPVTDEMFEFYLDLIERRILDVLSDPDNAWADVWRGLCTSVVRIERARVDAAQQVRLAGHQLKLVCEIVDDPVIGLPLEKGGGFERFMEMLERENSPDMVARASYIRSILGDLEASEWVARQREMGLTGAENDALSLRPASTFDDQAVNAEEVTIAMDGLSETVVGSQD